MNPFIDERIGNKIVNAAIIYKNSAGQVYQ